MELVKRRRHWMSQRMVDQSAGGNDKTVRLWETRSGRCLQVWRSPAAVTSLLWRSELLFIGSPTGLVAALQRNLAGLFVLMWARCGRPPALNLGNSDFTGVQGLTPGQTLLIQQRGGQTQAGMAGLIPDSKTKSLTEISSKTGLTPPSSLLKLPSVASAQPALFSQSAHQTKAKKSRALPPIPSYQGIKPRRHSDPGRLTK
jgi:hypothetical protein